MDGGQTIDNVWEMMNSNCISSCTLMTVTLQDFKGDAGIILPLLEGGSSSGSSSNGDVGGGGVVVPVDIPVDTPAGSGPVTSGAIDPIQG